MQRLSILADSAEDPAEKFIPPIKGFARDENETGSPGSVGDFCFIAFYICIRPRSMKFRDSRGVCGERVEQM